jgi:hypothetical protein
MAQIIQIDQPGNGANQTAAREDMQKPSRIPSIDLDKERDKERDIKSICRLLKTLDGSFVSELYVVLQLRAQSLRR